jgi:eukaryotic-like serine/threonine-protein kinase
MNEYAMPTIGDVIANKYRLEKVAGEGGMGIVYAAEHLLLKQRVAVKVLLPDAARSDAVVERFAREAQTAARINSEHVARVLDAGSLPSGAPFLVMEYLEGCDLEELLELQRKLPVSEVVDYAIQACEALAHAHAIGIVHRDLKPANLYLACRPDGGNAIKIIDFGISKSMRANPNQKKLTGQHVLGSPVYMSPEQLRNAKEIDGRADLWSLGVVVYEMLTSTTPFDADGVGEIFAAILANDPVPLCERNPAVPKGLSDIISKCLRRDTKERWQDAGELARALLPFGSGAWNDVVPRIDSLLARARMMKSLSTPIETKIVVEAIAAAAERAKTTGARSVPPPSQPKPTVIDTNPDGSSTLSEAAAMRSRRWPFFAGAVLVIGAVVVFGVVKTRAAASTQVATNEAPPPVTATSAAAPPSTAPIPPPPTTSESAAKSSAAPSASASSKKASGKPGAKGPRPKFLKTRE